MPERWLSLVVLVLLITLLLQGCASKPKELPIERFYRNPYSPKPWSLAIVPFRNDSGSETLDVMAVTDAFYSELQQIGDGLQVMPNNRVLAAMQKLQMRHVTNAVEVLALAEVLSVDAVIVGAVTNYDPYPPPQIGMIVQLYDRKGVVKEDSMVQANSKQLALEGKPFGLELKQPARPALMVVRVLDADKKDVIERIKVYAKEREGKNASFGQKLNPGWWEKYTTSRKYLGFVSYEIIGELLAQQAGLNGSVDGKERAGD